MWLTAYLIVLVLVVRQWPVWSVLWYGLLYFGVPRNHMGFRRWVQRWLLWSDEWRGVLDDDDDEGPSIVAVYPHGVFGEYAARVFLGERSCVFAGHWMLMWLPVVRECCLAVGYIPATREAIVEALTVHGLHVVLVPNGLWELMGEAHPPRQRRGMFWCAWRARVPIRPVAITCALGSHYRWLWPRSQRWRWRRWLYERSPLGYPWPVAVWPVWPRVRGNPITGVHWGPTIEAATDVNVMRARYYKNVVNGGDPAFHRRA